jgi:hypothetical protein
MLADQDGSFHPRPVGGTYPCGEAHFSRGEIGPRPEGSPRQQPEAQDMSWHQIVYGWPTIILAAAVFAIAFARARSWLGFAGLVCAAPFLWYATGAPRGWVYSPILFATLAIAAACLRTGRRRAAAVCVAPFGLVVVILAAAVMFQR